MDEDLQKQLDWMNTNLAAIVENQAMIYEEMKKIEGGLPEPESGVKAEPRRVTYFSPHKSI